MNQLNKLKFKRRFMKGYNQLKDDSCFNYFFFLKNYRIEFKYISFLKKLLKKTRLRHLKGRKTTASKIFVSLSKNYLLSKKSKNSRMGKGKGAFIRQTIKVKKFKPFIYFLGFNEVILNKLVLTFTKKTFKRAALFKNLNVQLFHWSNNSASYRYTSHLLLA